MKTMCTGCLRVFVLSVALLMGACAPEAVDFEPDAASIAENNRGVALMGQAHGKYTFFGHLKWTPVIAVGYVASIYVHLWVNSRFEGVFIG